MADDTRHKLFATIAVSLLFSILLVSSPVSLENFLHDHFVFFDGAYRISSGQTPHIDFETPFGGLSLLVLSLFQSASGSYAVALPATLTLFSTLLLFTSFLLLNKILTKKYFYLTLAFISIVCFSPFVPGTTPSKTSYAMWYNRYGWSIIVVLSILILSSYSKHNIKTSEYIYSSAAITVIAYIKPTFLAALIPLALLNISLKPERYKYFLISTIIPIISIATIEIFFPGFNKKYFLDLISASKSSSIFRGNFIGFLMYINKNSFYVILYFISLYIGILNLNDKKFLLSQGLILFFVTWWLTDQSTRGVPLGLAVLPIWIGNHIEGTTSNTIADGGSGTAFPIRSICLILALLATVPTMSNRLWALADYTKEGYTKAGDPSLPVRFEELDGLLVAKGNLGENLRRVATSGLTMNTSLCKYAGAPRPETDVQLKLRGIDYVESLHEAVDLAEDQIPPDKPIMVLDYVNSVNLLTGHPPLANKKLWYHRGRTFSENTLPPAKKWLKEKPYIMIPKIPIEYKSRNSLLKKYGCYIKREYELKKEGSLWKLLKHEE